MFLVMGVLRNEVSLHAMKLKLKWILLDVNAECLNMHRPAADIKILVRMHVFPEGVLSSI